MSEIASLERPEVLDALTQLLGVSDFLWEDFLRLQYANLFPVVQDSEGLGRQKSRDDFVRELQHAIESADSPEERRRTLNAFKDREMFRIDMRYIMRRSKEFGRFSAELTDLAEVVIEEAVTMCTEQLQEHHGKPLLENGNPCPVSVCALGKCGGREMGFASDIELMFVYGGMGQTDGAKSISATAYHNLLVRHVSEAIESKREGVFEIDLQLRPYGSAGNLAVSAAAFERYFAPSGPAWPYERQMLIKLRPISGDPGLGRRIQGIRDSIFDRMGPFDVAAMRAMRERQIRHLVTPGTTNAKFGPGGLVDLEYLVQGLQISYHRRHPELHGLTNTREALGALWEVGTLNWEDHRQLDGALVFLRRLIDALRMVRGHAKDLTIPLSDSAAYSFLARRLGYGADTKRLEEDITSWMGIVQETEKRLL
jgi:glutamate-ammonia-ligase adenylyltransferase